MSDLGSNPERSPSTNDSIRPDLAALAASLQEAAVALLALPAAQTRAQPGSRRAGPLPEREGEIRSYYFPQAALNLERDLLRKYRVRDFQGLLEEVHTLLVGLVKLMQSVHKDVRGRGYVISSLGAQIEHASALLLRMRHIYDRVMPVEK